MKRSKKEVENLNPSLTSLKLALPRRRVRIVVMPVIMIALSLTMLSATSLSPVKTVKGLLVDTGQGPSNPFFFIDAGRITFTGGSSGVEVYDINSASATSFSPPAGQLCVTPSLSGNKVIDFCATSIIAPVTIYYCILPNASPVQPCGPWTAIVSGLPGISALAAFGSFPQINGDLVVYALTSGFGYYRFSSGLNFTVNTSTQPHGVTSNGAIIAFSAKPSSASSSDTIRFYDTTLPPASRSVTDTGLLGFYPSIAQYTIAFNDNSTTAKRIGYYDIRRNQASPAGTGPLGELLYASSPAIWGDRIVFQTDEATIGFDCNGDGTISSSDNCLGYWNIRAPSYVATTLAPSAAPAITSYPVIYDKIIAFQAPNGHLQYVTVPMQGDVNQDGVVNQTDKTDVTNCLNQVLKGSVC